MAKSSSTHFRVSLTPIQKATIGVAVLFVVIVGITSASSPTVSLGVFGLFLELLGAILLGQGLIKTNDELIELANHHEKFDKQKLVSHLTKDRFFMVVGIFLIVLGTFLQIVFNQFKF